MTGVEFIAEPQHYFWLGCLVGGVAVMWFRHSVKPLCINCTDSAYIDRHVGETEEIDKYCRNCGDKLHQEDCERWEHYLLAWKRTLFRSQHENAGGRDE